MGPKFRVSATQYAQSKIVKAMKDKRSYFRTQRIDKYPDIFTEYQSTQPQNLQYHQQAIQLLRIEFPFLPTETISQEMITHRNNFIATGRAIADNLGGTDEAPMYKGLPIPPVQDPPADPIPEEDLDRQLKAEKEITDNEQYSDAYIQCSNQQEAALQYPPVPHLPPRDEESLPPTEDNLPHSSPKVECHQCHNQVYQVYVSACTQTYFDPNHPENSHGYLCPDCLRRCCQRAYPALATAAQPPLTESNMQVNALKQSKIDQVKCPSNHTILEDAILRTLTPKEHAIMRGVPLASQLPITTARAGICPNCYFPIIPTWSHEGVWMCTHPNCQTVCFMDI